MTGERNKSITEKNSALCDVRQLDQCLRDKIQELKEVKENMHTAQTEKSDAVAKLEQSKKATSEAQEAWAASENQAEELRQLVEKNAKEAQYLTEKLQIADKALEDKTKSHKTQLGEQAKAHESQRWELRASLYKEEKKVAISLAVDEVKGK